MLSGWYGKELDAARYDALLIPPLCAHGFLTLEDDTLVEYAMDCDFAPEHSRGVRFDDPAFNIEWPRCPRGDFGSRPVLSRFCSMKRPVLLLTGASGFIGRQTLFPLLLRGFEVHAVTRAVAGLEQSGGGMASC